MNLITRLNRILAESCGYILFLVTILVALEVVLRNFGFMVFGIIELAVYLVIAAVFFGLGHCEEKDEHVRITLLLSRVNPKCRHFMRIFAALCTLTAMIYASYASILSVMKSIRGSEAIMANTTPMYAWPARMAITIGLVMFCLQLVLTIIHEYKLSRSVGADTLEK